MKNFKRILALVLAVMMVATSVVAISAAEADDKVAYNETAVVRLNKLGIFQGTTNGLEADKNVTRAEMAQFTGRVMTGKVETNYWENYQNSTTFKDIDMWAEGAIAYAYENGVVVGRSEDTFDPNGNVTYQEALTMVVRSLGYTGLSYPNGFINKAIKLGLTDGIANVNYADAAVRGVIATILYNALYAEDSLFADNFDLESGLYMLVATPTVEIGSAKIPGASINGYVGKKLNEGYVAFAPIGADYKAVNQTAKYVYAKTSQISDDIPGNYAHKLGYAYTLTFENDVLTWADECDTKTFVNYGDDRDITATYIDYDHNYTRPNYQDGWFLTMGNQAYNLVDGYSADYNAPTGTHNLILYADLGTEYTKVDDYAQCFDANGNIINGNTGAVLLHLMNGAYYKLVGTNYIKATTDEILGAITVFENALNSDFVVIEGGDTFAANNKLGVNAADAVIAIAKNYFCEVTAMDYDNDGIYDAAIYTPYYLGYVGDVGTTFTLSGVTNAAGSDVLLKNATTANYAVTGKTDKLSPWAWYVYSFNRHTNTIDVKEIAKAVSGKVEWGVKGAVSTASSIYEDSQVSIGGTTYQVGGWNYQNLLGLNQVKDFDDSQRNAISAAMGTTVTSTYYNGWNDVLDFGMTDACSGFKGYAVAGHLIHGVPLLSASASYGYVMFNAYQSDFAVENDQILVDAIVDTTGEYKTIAINSVNSMEFTNMEFNIFVEYINTFYANAGLDASAYNTLYSYFFDEGRLATHQATALYKAVERQYVINRLTETYALGTVQTIAKNQTLIYAVNGTNADGSYQLRTDRTPTGVSAANVGVVNFTLGISDVAIQKDKTPIRTNANTVFTFVAKDGIYTYVGMPADNYQLVLTADTKIYKADSAQIMIVDTTRCVTDIALGDIDWAEKVQDVELVNGNVIPDCTCGDGAAYITDNDSRCDGIVRNHIDTWAFREYIPYISATFQADEVYMVTAKTSNTKIYYENGTMYYVYANLYNMVDAKYEESVIFTEAEVAVFDDVVYYEDSNATVGTNYGVIITRDDEDGIKTFEPADYKVAAGNNDLFTLWTQVGSQITYTNLNAGVYEKSIKDNTGAISHVVIDGNALTVNKVEFVTVYKTGRVSANGTPEVEIGDFSKIAANAIVYYTYDAVAGVLTGYAFN